MSHWLTIAMPPLQNINILVPYCTFFVLMSVCMSVCMSVWMDGWMDGLMYVFTRFSAQQMPTSSTHLRWHSSCLWHALRDGDCTVCQEPREQRCVFWSDLEDSWSLRPILQPAGNLQNVFEKTGAKGQKQCKATAQAKARLKRRNWRVNKTVFSTRPTTDKQERNMLYVKHMYCDWLWFVLVIVFLSKGMVA